MRQGLYLVEAIRCVTDLVQKDLQKPRAVQRRIEHQAMPTTTEGFPQPIGFLPRALIGVKEHAKGIRAKAELQAPRGFASANSLQSTSTIAHGNLHSGWKTVVVHAQTLKPASPIFPERCIVRYWQAAGPCRFLA
jgi:hypothetical protein